MGVLTLLTTGRPTHTVRSWAVAFPLGIARGPHPLSAPAALSEHVTVEQSRDPGWGAGRGSAWPHWALRAQLEAGPAGALRWHLSPQPWATLVGLSKGPFLCLR